MRVTENHWEYYILPFLVEYYSDHNCWYIEPETFDRRSDVAEENRKEVFIANVLSKFSPSY